MNKEEFMKKVQITFAATSESIMDVVKQYIHEAEGFTPSSVPAGYIGEYLEDGNNYFPGPQQIGNLWRVAGETQSVDLIHTLLEIQNKKCTYDNLCALLETGFHNGFMYTVYEYDVEDGHLYELIQKIIGAFPMLNHGDKLLRYYLEMWKPLPVFQTALNQLMYKALIGQPKAKAVKILLEYGADPFDNYWEGFTNTEIPIVFKVIQSGIWNIKPLKEYNAPEEKWNVTDKWGRNLLHHAIYDEHIYNMLLEKGVSEETKAIPVKEIWEEVTVRKIKGTLPKEYKKKPKELIKF